MIYVCSTLRKKGMFPRNMDSLYSDDLRKILSFDHWQHRQTNGWNWFVNL